MQRSVGPSLDHNERESCRRSLDGGAPVGDTRWTMCGCCAMGTMTAGALAATVVRAPPRHAGSPAGLSHLSLLSLSSAALSGWGWRAEVLGAHGPRHPCRIELPGNPLGIADAGLSASLANAGASVFQLSPCIMLGRIVGAGADNFRVIIGLPYSVIQACRTV